MTSPGFSHRFAPAHGFPIVRAAFPRTVFVGFVNGAHPQGEGREKSFQSFVPGFGRRFKGVSAAFFIRLG